MAAGGAAEPAATSPNPSAHATACAAGKGLGHLRAIHYGDGMADHMSADAVGYSGPAAAHTAAESLQRHSARQLRG